jgi:hypothetical protein
MEGAPCYREREQRRRQPILALVLREVRGEAGIASLTRIASVKARFAAQKHPSATHTRCFRGEFRKAGRRALGELRIIICLPPYHRCVCPHDAPN